MGRLGSGIKIGRGTHLYQEEPAEEVQKSGGDAQMPGVSGMLSWEETLGQAQNRLERLWPGYTLGSSLRSWWK